MLLFKISSIKNSVLYLIMSAKELSTNVIHSETSPVYFDKCFTRQVIHFGVRNVLVVEKMVLMTNDWPPCSFSNHYNDRSSRFPYTAEHVLNY